MINNDNIAIILYFSAPNYRLHYFLFLYHNYFNKAHKTVSRKEAKVKSVFYPYSLNIVNSKYFPETFKTNYFFAKQ